MSQMMVLLFAMILYHCEVKPPAKSN